MLQPRFHLFAIALFSDNEAATETADTNNIEQMQTKKRPKQFFSHSG